MDFKIFSAEETAEIIQRSDRVDPVTNADVLYDEAVGYVDVVHGWVLRY